MTGEPHATLLFSTIRSAQCAFRAPTETTISIDDMEINADVIPSHDQHGREICHINIGCQQKLRSEPVIQEPTPIAKPPPAIMATPPTTAQHHDSISPRKWASFFRSRHSASSHPRPLPSQQTESRSVAATVDDTEHSALQTSNRKVYSANKSNASAVELPTT